MFILNNIHGYNHNERYETSEDQDLPIFDISQKQINSRLNCDWHDLNEGDLVTVVQDTYNLSTIHEVTSIEQVDTDTEEEKYFIVRGEVVAKFDQDLHYSSFLRKYSISHIRIRDNKFTPGLNIINLESQVNNVKVKSKHDAESIHELKELSC